MTETENGNTGAGDSTNQVTLAQQRNELAELRNRLAEQRSSLAQRRTELAMIRTHTSADRTLMAWIRTSLAMIGFGFSLHKFFEYLAALPDLAGKHHTDAPRNLGLVFIALGTLVLAAAACEHLRLKRCLSGDGRVGVSLVLVVASVVIFLGVFAFLGVLAQAGPF